MRKFIINFLLSTLSKKQKKQILKELKNAIKLVTRKRGKRGPYKKRINKAIEVKLPPIRIEDIPIDSLKDSITPIKTKRTGTTAKLRKLDTGDITWLKQPVRNIAPIASGIGKVERKIFTCTSIGANSCEVKRVA